MKKNRVTFYVLCLYSLLLLLGGLWGYIEKGSLISLTMAITMSLVIDLSALWLIKEKKKGFYLAIGSSASFMLVFIVRYFMTYKTTPGLFAALSGATLVYLLLRLPKWNHFFFKA